MTASTYLAGIVDGIMVGNILGTVELYAVNLTSCIIFLRSIPIAISTYGGNTLSIIRKSKRDQNGADTVFTASFWLGIISTVIISALGIAFIVPSANCSHRVTFRSPICLFNIFCRCGCTLRL